MKPYDNKFLVEKINEYNEKLKPLKIGDHQIVEKDGLKGKVRGYLYEKEEDIDFKLPELVGRDKYWMILGPKEVESTYGIIKKAHGRVGVVGLGLGYTVEEMAKNDNVSEIVVYEIEKEIIELYKKNFKENKKIKIVNEDAYKVKGEKFDYFFVDIYEYKLTPQVVSDYKHFNEALEIEDYVFWGVEHFLLSCRYEDIIWVYIPEIWMELSKDIFVSLQHSGYLKWYYKLDSKLVKEILEEFKEILND